MTFYHYFFFVVRLMGIHKRAWKVGKSILPAEIRMHRPRTKHHWIGRGNDDLWLTELLNFSQVGDYFYISTLKHLQYSIDRYAQS